MIRIVCIAFVFWSGPLLARDWQSFSRGWGYGLAIEDLCPTHWLGRNALNDDVLSASDYQRAQDDALKYKDSVDLDKWGLSCMQARLLVAEILDIPLNEAWELRP